MAQERAQRDLLAIVAAPVVHPAGDRIGERQPSCLEQLHGDGCGRQHFRQRCEIEDRVVLGRGRVRLVVEPAERLPPHDARPMPDFDDRCRIRAIAMALQDHRCSAAEVGSHQSSIFNHQSSIFNHQSSIINL